ncbi:hypothetical protein [Dankookia rubra]|uniref:hypothetical protein n=1 Tax=Dankookia rubra TaxID=1442381 RepID=UPI001878AD47|nr:hypothetical protein [Dankookia rubra]
MSDAALKSGLAGPAPWLPCAWSAAPGLILGGEGEDDEDALDEEDEFEDEDDLEEDEEFEEDEDDLDDEEDLDDLDEEEAED